jgi:hypothetical protein
MLKEVEEPFEKDQIGSSAMVSISVVSWDFFGSRALPTSTSILREYVWLEMMKAELKPAFSVTSSSRLSTLASWFFWCYLRAHWH